MKREILEFGAQVHRVTQLAIFEAPDAATQFLFNRRRLVGQCCAPVQQEAVKCPRPAGAIQTTTAGQAELEA